VFAFDSHYSTRILNKLNIFFENRQILEAELFRIGGNHEKNRDIDPYSGADAQHAVRLRRQAARRRQ